MAKAPGKYHHFSFPFTVCHFLDTVCAFAFITVVSLSHVLFINIDKKFTSLSSHSEFVGKNI